MDHQQGGRLGGVSLVAHLGAEAQERRVGHQETGVGAIQETEEGTKYQETEVGATQETAAGGADLKTEGGANQEIEEGPCQDTGAAHQEGVEVPPPGQVITLKEVVLRGIMMENRTGAVGKALKGQEGSDWKEQGKKI